VRRVVDQPRKDMRRRILRQRLTNRRCAFETLERSRQLFGDG
jgi:hypothetical protein